MQTLFRPFRRDDSGAVTVDWVVLTAAIVGLGIGVIGSIADGQNNVGVAVSSRLANNIPIGTP